MVMEVEKMGTFFEDLISSSGIKEVRSEINFTPAARYFPEMDVLTYLNEDCSYRADRVDKFLTVLWHPYEKKLVGIKLKGFKFFFERLKSILAVELGEKEFFSLIAAIELVMTSGLATEIMNSVEYERRKEMYFRAIELAKRENVRIEYGELLAA